MRIRCEIRLLLFRDKVLQCGLYVSARLWAMVHACSNPVLGVLRAPAGVRGPGASNLIRRASCLRTPSALLSKRRPRCSVTDVALRGRCSRRNRRRR